MGIKQFLLGRPLRNNELSHEKLSTFWGVPIMASDAVSSVAYAIEEILLVLVPMLGIASIPYLGMIAIPILVLLLVLVFSYSQIIDEYPSGGGAYIVSAENLGKKTSLVAASALIIDYVLTVAVSLSSATSALVAAFPVLEGSRVVIALIGLSLITLMNLRGVNESSKVFGVPTYGFIVIMFLLIVTGLVEYVTGNLAPIKYVADAPVETDALLTIAPIFLLLKAFASGCSALTGVEAVSNAVPSFREPSKRNAKRVLYILAGIIIFIFGGSVILAMALKVMPLTGHTVIAQMGEAVFGKGTLFYVLQFATSLILLLAANTAYSGLPTLLSILAADGYLPRQFGQRGFKLAFSNGIMFIFFAAGILIALFHANTHHLIPLYSVGVFISFTLSQGGMVIRWFKTRQKGWKGHAFVNGFGAFMTAVGAVIVLVAKFKDGAWMLAVAIPLISLIMGNIRKHYEFIGEQLKVDDFKDHYYRSTSSDKNLCIVLASAMTRSVLKTLNYANALSSNVIALHISTDAERTAALKRKWEEFEIDVPLEVVEAPYRDIVTPINDYISQKEALVKPGENVSVIMVKFVERSWYDNLLHNQTTYFIERRLRKHKNVVTIIVPYIYFSQNHNVKCGPGSAK